MDIAEYFLEIIELVASPEQFAAFPPGASELEIQELERNLGYRLPDNLRRIYKLHNGEPRLDNLLPLGLFCDYNFLSLQEVKVQYDEWESTRNYWATDGNVEPFTFSSNPIGTVNCVLSDPAWIPIAANSGHCLAVDFNPGPMGCSGQIINFSCDDQVHFQITSTFEDFLRLVVDRYRKRRWHGGVFESSPWSLYDALLRERG
jgi:internalin A